MKFNFSTDFLQTCEEEGGEVKDINPLKCDKNDFRALISYFLVKQVKEADELRGVVAKLKAENTTLQTSVNDVVEENLALRQKVDILSNNDQQRETTVRDLEDRVRKLEILRDSAEKDAMADRDRVLNLERHSRSRNLRFAIKTRETDKEDTTKLLNDELTKQGINVTIEHSHRVGKKDPKGVKQRQIIACFLYRPDRFKVINKRSELFTAGVQVYDDLCAYDFALKKKHSDHMKQLHLAGKRVRFSRGFWWVDGAKFEGTAGTDDEELYD